MSLDLRRASERAGLFQVYRFYAEGGSLLYVGMTGAFSQRMGSHALTKDWWPTVARVELEHFTTQMDAEIRESELIHTERPLFNVEGRNLAEVHSPVEEFMRAVFVVCGICAVVSVEQVAEELDQVTEAERERFLDQLDETLAFLHEVRGAVAAAQ